MERRRFGAILREARQAGKFGLRAVEAGADIAAGYVQHIEKGTNLPPKPAYVVRLARFFGLDPYELLMRAYVEQAGHFTRQWFNDVGLDFAGWTLTLRQADGTVLVAFHLDDDRVAELPPAPDDLRAQVQAYVARQPGRGPH